VTRRVTLLLLCLTGCQPEIEFVEWDPLDHDEVATAFSEPTAILENVLTPERLQAIAERMPLLLEHTRFASEVVDAMDEAADLPADGGGAAGSGTDDEPKQRSDQGTVYYFGMGCPGAGPKPDFNTNNGVMRIDSERLDSLDPRALFEGRSALFTFEDCQAGQVRLSGRAPVALRLAASVIDPTGVLPPVQGGFGMAADLSDLQANDTVLPVGVTGFLCGGFGNCAEYQDVKAEFVGNGEGTSVASFALDRDYWLSPTSLVLKLATARGSASCQYFAADRVLDCEVDEGN
jgi:hypothetical protein